MKVFRDLEISIDPSQVDDFISKLEGRLSNGWRRDKDEEERMRWRKDDSNFVFLCEEALSRKAALLGLFKRSNKNALYVANIVPQNEQQLSYDEYNAILVDFQNKFISPTAKELGLTVTFTKDDQTLEDWISHESAEKLRRFSRAANKSTGSSHPHDEMRWFDFMVSIVRNGERFSTDQLQRWLLEEEHWPEDVAIRLVLEFEQGISLLRYYRGEE